MLPFVFCISQLVGCAHTGPLKLDLDPAVRVPAKPVLIFFADGVRADLVEQMIDAGELPNLKRYVYDPGCKVQYGISSLPTITYAATASITTGMFPGHHGIMGNKWFDRNSARFQNYSYIRTYQQIDRDLRAPTIFELLNDKYTVTIQTANRLGAIRAIDNWMSSGINWYFKQQMTVDQLVAIRFELIARSARDIGRWPELILAYFPAVDEIGHRFGADSAKYRQALVNLDNQIGRICRALERVHLLDKYYIFFVSDHGHVRAGKQNNFSPTDFFRKQLGLDVLSKMFMENAHPNERHEYLNRKFRVVIVNGGTRRAHIHLRTGKFWYVEPTYDEVCSFLEKAKPPIGNKTIMAALAEQEAIRLVAAKVDSNRIRIFFRDQEATIERQDGQKTYRYRPVRGDPLDYSSYEHTRRLIDDQFHDADTWLDASCRSDFPDFVPQIVEMFDSPRAGQIVIFAARGWDFNRNDLGGHGSVLKDDVIVPFVLVGPDIPAGQILNARLVDIMPTVLDILGCRDRLARIGRIDGKSLMPKVRHVAQSGRENKQ